MSCSVKGAIAQGARKVVSVNGVVIRYDDISRETQNHPGPTPVAAWTAAACALAVRELLLQEARCLDLRPAPLVDEEGRQETDEEAMIRSLFECEVATPVPDEASCRRYYQQNRRRFRAADIYEASHILIAARRDQPQAFAAAREQAALLLSRLRDHPGLFGEIATAHSDCPSAASGGNLGQITVGQTTAEFERALEQLSVGALCEAPVATRYGFHIIRLDRRIEGRQLPFEAVVDRIAEYLSEKVRRTAAAQYIARLVSRSAIEGITLPGADVHRVTSGIQVTSGIPDAAR